MTSGHLRIYTTLTDVTRKHLLDPGILLSNKRSNLVHVWRMVC